MGQQSVAVITPVYNGKKYIETVVRSVLSQRNIDLEYIIIDDGSTDGTDEILRKLMENFPNSFKVISQSNKGEAHAVNVGLKCTSSEYVVVVSADDPLLERHLSTMVKALNDHSDAVLAYSDWLQIDEDGRTIRKIQTLEYDERALIGDFVCIPGPGAMFRRSAIRRTLFRDPQYRYVSDYDAWLHLALQGPFIRVPQVLATYRIHPMQVTAKSDASKMAKEIEGVIDNFFLQCSLPTHILSLRRRAKAFSKYYSGLQALRSNQVSGKAKMLQSLILAPPLPTSWESHRRSPLLVLLILIIPRPNLLFQSYLRLRT